MQQTKAKAFLFDVQTRKGKQAVWRCYADHDAEAEDTAKWMCRLLGALYLGNLTTDRVCVL